VVEEQTHTQVLVIHKTVVQVADNQEDIVIKLVLLHKEIHLNIQEQVTVTQAEQLTLLQDTLVVAEAEAVQPVKMLHQTQCKTQMVVQVYK
jgi:hypothetical protein